jgi:hypothetical protein
MENATLNKQLEIGTRKTLYFRNDFRLRLRTVTQSENGKRVLQGFLVSSNSASDCGKPSFRHLTTQCQDSREGSPSFGVIYKRFEPLIQLILPFRCLADDGIETPNPSVQGIAEKASLPSTRRRTTRDDPTRGKLEA